MQAEQSRRFSTFFGDRCPWDLRPIDWILTSNGEPLEGSDVVEGIAKQIGATNYSHISSTSLRLDKEEHGRMDALHLDAVKSTRRKERG
jgi:hypothetical protein